MLEFEMETEPTLIVQILNILLQIVVFIIVNGLFILLLFGLDRFIDKRREDAKKPRNIFKEEDVFISGD